jgi:hypothetical protein
LKLISSNPLASTVSIAIEWGTSVHPNSIVSVQIFLNQYVPFIYQRLNGVVDQIEEQMQAMMTQKKLTHHEVLYAKLTIAFFFNFCFDTLYFFEANINQTFD